MRPIGKQAPLAVRFRNSHLKKSQLLLNVPLKKIQAILRHKSTTTTDRYLHELQGADTDLDTVFGNQQKNGKVINMGENL